MKPDLRPTGISVVGDVPWGAHLSLFYRTHEDLIDGIVPYFAAGLEAGERCVWAPSEPSIEQAALECLRQQLPDLDARLERGALEFFRYEDFFGADGGLDIARALAQWEKWEEQARVEGYSGLRGSGNLCWVERSNWSTCVEYEQLLHKVIAGGRALVLCSYPLARVEAADIFDTARAHHLVVARRDGEWEVLETPALKGAKEQLQRLNDELEQRVGERTRQLSAVNEELRQRIEERRRAETQLRRSETYLEHGQRLSHAGSYAEDVKSGEPTFWSAETFRIFGLAPQAQPPSRDEVFRMIHPADRERARDVHESATRTNRGAQAEFRVVLPTGAVRCVHAFASAMTDESGRAIEIVGTLMDITDRKQAAARLARTRREARERVLEQRFAATLEERARLAREIHDSLLQGVAGIALQLRATLPHLGGAPRSVVESIRRTVDLAETTIRDARRAVWDMRAPALEQQGLPTALEEAVRREGDGLDVRFTLDGVRRTLRPVVEDTILRIGQEAAINAVRHSGARTLSVTLAYRPHDVQLTVMDDGAGFNTEQTGWPQNGRWGIVGMRERADRVDAHLVFRSAEAKGTTIELCVPTAPKLGRRKTSARQQARAS